MTCLMAYRTDLFSTSSATPENALGAQRVTRPYDLTFDIADSGRDYDSPFRHVCLIRDGRGASSETVSDPRAFKTHQNSGGLS